jgi:D-alanine-D-alanine ligase
MVKPVCGMCSCGVKKAHNLQELRHAVAVLQRRYPDQVLIERLVDGFDITVPVLEARGVPRCLPPLQRFFADRNDPACQHFLLPHPSSELREGRPIPAVLSHAQHRAACDVARAAFTVLGLRHCARIDLRLSGLTAWFLEANHKPDLTRNSLFAQSAALAGIEYEELIDRLLAGACHPGSIRSPALAARPRSRLRLR